MTLTFFSNMSNMKITIIYLVLGYAFFFGGTTLLPEDSGTVWIAIGASVLFLIVALYYVTREYGKEYVKVK